MCDLENVNTYADDYQKPTLQGVWLASPSPFVSLPPNCPFSCLDLGLCCQLGLLFVGNNELQCHSVTIAQQFWSW